MLEVVNADIFHGDLLRIRHDIIKKNSQSIARAVAQNWGYVYEKIEIYSYDLESSKELDQLLRQGYYLYTSKGERVVKSYRQEEVKKFKGEKLNLWEYQ